MKRVPQRKDQARVLMAGKRSAGRRPGTAGPADVLPARVGLGVVFMVAKVLWELRMVDTRTGAIPATCRAICGSSIVR
jgi:hypothetical protein